MKTRTLLVDSSFLLKRSFYGAKNTYTNKFGHIGGLYSFYTTLRKLIKEHNINKVILAWDGENGGIYRHNLYPGYKANRKNKTWHGKIELSEAEIKREKQKEESVLKQRKRIQQYAEELYLRQIEVDKIEADDLIAAYCKDYHENEDIIIYTNDRDFSQLLDYNIQILFGNIDGLVTRGMFQMNFDYHYRNSLTMKIICGDVSDNIEGIKGIKETTLIKHFPELKSRHVTVKEICQRADQINKERVSNKKKPLKIFESLLSSIDKLKLNNELMNLSEPFLNEEAEEELIQLSMPLLDEDRGSKNLFELMVQDDFLSVYGGSFKDYVLPFFPIITNEKKVYQEFLKKSQVSH